MFFKNKTDLLVIQILLETFQKVDYLGKVRLGVICASTQCKCFFLMY